MGNQDAVRTALLAAADQGFASHRQRVQEMVAFYRGMQGQGVDNVVNTGSLIIANYVAYDRLRHSQLLAVAVAMLAEDEPRTGGV